MHQNTQIMFSIYPNTAKYQYYETTQEDSCLLTNINDCHLIIQFCLIKFNSFSGDLNFKGLFYKLFWIVSKQFLSYVTTKKKVENKITPLSRKG